MLIQTDSPTAAATHPATFLARMARQVAPHLLGGLCGILLCGWWSLLLVNLGGTLPVVSGLLVAATIGLALGWREPRASRFQPQASAGLILLAAWTLCVTLLAPVLTAPLGLIPAAWLATPYMEFFYAGLAGALLLTLPHFVLASLLTAPATGSGAVFEANRGRTADSVAGPRQIDVPDWMAVRFGRQRAARYAERLRLGWREFQAIAAVPPSLGGLGAGLLVTPVWLAPQVGLPLVCGAAAWLCFAWGLCRLGGSTTITGTVGSASQPLAARHRLTVPSARRTHFLILDALLPLATGGLLSLSGRVIGQLWLQGLYGNFAMIAGVVWGVAAVRAVLGRPGFPRPLALFEPLPGLLLLLAAGGIVAGFKLETAAALWINAHITTAWGVLGLRGLGCASAGLPAGMVLGLVLFSRRATEDRPWGAVQLLLTTAGWILFRWSVPATALTAWCVIGLGGIHACGKWFRAGGMLPRTSLGRSCAALALLGALAAPLGVTQFDPVRAARLLFSARVAAAVHASADGDLLLALDDARALATIEGRDSIWTLFKRRGELLSIREDGVPFGEAGLNLSRAPEAPAELAAAAIPLAIHPRAEHILVVGLGSSVAVRTCLEFPVRSVTCLEPDRDLIDLTAQYAGPQWQSALTDPRLEVQHAAPVLASAARPPRAYDVILVNERQLAGPRAIGLQHRDVFARWGRQLATEGLLCVRLEYVDFGAAPVQDLARTLAEVFPQVVVWEAGPGELLLLGSPSERPLIEEGLLDRCSAAHVRRVFARIGWDWSLPLSLVVVQGERLQTLVGAGTSATAWNARLEYALPGEIARWGAKQQELQTALAASASTPLAVLPESPARADLQKRLADVGEQRSLISRFPDHYWAYRKVLKERLQERPRVDIARVGLNLHPEDERRKQYLQTLGHVATAEHPARTDVDRLVDYIEPYDPLVTPFVSGEAARLYARCSDHDGRAAELQEWLRSVYYGPGFDRSVRDAVSALELLLDDAGALPDPVDRWDHVNALLEVLRERWNLRSQQTVPSKYEPADAAEALAVAKRAVEFLAATHEAAGIDREWAETRCRVIERTFVRALRTYHAQQTARLRALEQQQSAMHRSNVTQ